MKLTNLPPAGSVPTWRELLNKVTRESLHFPLAVVGLILALATVPAYGGNLLNNPGFEANSGHVVAAGWTYFSPPTPPG